MHIDNENKYILILGEGPTQRLYDNTLRVEANCASNFTQPKRQTLWHLGAEEAIASHLPPPPPPLSRQAICFCTEYSKERNNKSSEFIWMPSQAHVSKVQYTCPTFNFTLLL